MSLFVVVRTAEEVQLFWQASSTSNPLNVWTFREGRCLYIEHLDNVAQLKYRSEISAVGLDETGRQVVWTRPADSWKFYISLFGSAHADYLDDGFDPAG